MKKLKLLLAVVMLAVAIQMAGATASVAAPKALTQVVVRANIGQPGRRYHHRPMHRWHRRPMRRRFHHRY